MPTDEIVQADLTYVDGRFASGTRVAISPDGRIAGLGDLPERPTRKLARRALLPGFINAHSHAFQRGLRGSGQVFPESAGSFWSWRAAMYELVQSLTPARFRTICRAAFDEMLAAGFTTVAEFHYLHHSDADVRDYAMDDLLLEAAREAGIRLVLLATYYHSGGFDAPLETGQRRFATPSVESFVEHLDSLAERLDPRTQSLGIAAHSMRAVPSDDLVALAREAAARQWVFHIHLEEQPLEIEQCRAAFGCTPLEWMLEHVEVDSSMTAVHATHSDPTLLGRWIERGANVCVCPTTEADLGDGVADWPREVARRDWRCIGSDSNVRIDPLEELRWLEWTQRLARQRRGVITDPDGQVAQALLRCGTENAARSVGIDAGRIEIGAAADLIAVDLEHPTLIGAKPETLAANLMFGTTGDLVRETCVAGRWVQVAT